MNKLDNQNKEAVVEKEAETTAQTSSPQVEVPTTEEQTAQVEVDQPQQEQVSDVESVETKDPREFQIKRLAEENKRLKAERQGSAFDAFRPQGQTGQVDIRNYTDQYTGEVNYPAYNAAVNTQIQTVATQTTQELLDEQNARSKHPDLFEDPDTEQEIADLWVAAKLRGENTSVAAIAERVAKRNSKDVSKAEKRGAEKILQEVSVKEQAGLSASGQTSQGMQQQMSDEDQQVLSERTRVGDEDAIVARLSRIPWANK